MEFYENVNLLKRVFFFFFFFFFFSCSVQWLFFFHGAVNIYFVKLGGPLCIRNEYEFKPILFENVQEAMLQ